MLAAFKHPITGTITAGDTHDACWPNGDETLLDSLSPDALWESQGFLHGGRFISRDEAYALGETARHDNEKPSAMLCTGCGGRGTVRAWSIMLEVYLDRLCNKCGGNGSPPRVVAPEAVGAA